MSRTQEEIGLEQRMSSTVSVATDEVIAEDIEVVSIEHSNGVSHSSGDAARFIRPEIRVTSFSKDWQRISDVEQAEPLPFWYRAFERLVALVALLFFALPSLVIALVVRVGTPGPALFIQQRLGLGAKQFTFVKFRTMFLDARERCPELYRYCYSDEELHEHFFKVDEDPRVTPQGRWLRRTTLDEIPNFLAVLSGKMSLVGPRPEIPEMLPYYKGQMLNKFSVRPGITGLAQTCGRGRLNFYDTVAFDLEYVKKQGVWLNLKILCRTVKIVLNSHGAF